MGRASSIPRGSLDFRFQPATAGLLASAFFSWLLNFDRNRACISVGDVSLHVNVFYDNSLDRNGVRFRF